jgi:hypothetical protein
VTVHHNKSLFNNQTDASIIQIYSVIKLYMFRAGLMTASKQGQDGTAVPNVQ